MDIARPIHRRRVLLRRGLTITATAVVLVALSWGLASMKAAAPTVDRATVWTDTVRRGPLDREVRGTGNLAPKEIRWVTTSRQGVIDKLRIEPGTAIAPDTVIMVLANPQLEKEVQDAKWQLHGALAEYKARKATLENDLLSMQSDLARLRAQLAEARLKADADEQLYRKEVISQGDYTLSQERVRQLQELIDIETRRFEKRRATQPDELAVVKARVEQSRAMYELLERDLEGLHVKAGIPGVLQQIAPEVEIGRHVLPGAPLAKVFDPTELKGVLRVPEVQAPHVQVDQVVRVDTRNGIVQGRVTRIDPAVRDGSVTVDVELVEPLPAGTRPDLTVVATIVIEHLDDVLYVGRPVSAQSDITMGLFKLIEGGSEAIRVAVQLGRSSISAVEIVQGLAAGDKVILSDMSRYDDVDRVRLK